jgi:hypothetical protein
LHQPYWLVLPCTKVYWQCRAKVVFPLQPDTKASQVDNLLYAVRNL